MRTTHPRGQGKLVYISGVNPLQKKFGEKSIVLDRSQVSNEKACVIIGPDPTQNLKTQKRHYKKVFFFFSQTHEYDIINFPQTSYRTQHKTFLLSHLATMTQQIMNPKLGQKMTKDFVFFFEYETMHLPGIRIWHYKFSSNTKSNQHKTTIFNWSIWPQ